MDEARLTLAERRVLECLSPAVPARTFRSSTMLEVTMSKAELAGFLRRVAEDGRVQRELIEVAGRHGYRFTLEELAAVDFAGVSDRIAALHEEDDDEERSDPGFGIIEVPG